jgi:uncharacterized protein (TIGR02246 family)
MPEDEQAIRAVVAAWLEATRRGDTRTVMELMTHDALFLTPGHPPMDRTGFEAASRAMAASRMRIEPHSDIQGIHIEGALACVWSNMTVVVTPEGSGNSETRSGQVLTVFRKLDGRWRLYRDANLLVKV